MPTYDYKCEACGKTFEKFQSITAPPIKQCPACKKQRVKRLIGTGAGLIFKGSGFYITDYRDAGYKEAAKKDSGGTSTDSKDSKPADTTAKKPTAESKPAASKPTESKPAASTPTPSKSARKK
jgi:putative FmdB family regulatory protein